MQLVEPPKAPLTARIPLWLGVARNTGLGWLRLGASAPGKEVATSSQTAPSAETTIGQAIADLDRLNRGTEEGFLRIGGKLAEFSSEVKQISSGLTALLALISGEEGQREYQALTCALDRSLEMRAHSKAGIVVMGGMHHQAGQLKGTLLEFHKTVSTFRTLGVLTRIETARLGSAGADFGNLATDVKSLATDVQDRVDAALDAATFLLPPIEIAMQQVTALEQGQSEDLLLVISGVQASLLSFHEMQNRTRDAAARLGTRYGAVSQAFNRLIVSIQFHDITRQQVEHVIDMLRRIDSECQLSNQRVNTTAILALQSSQLGDAAERFAVSVASIAESLDEIGIQVKEMANESRMLAGLNADEEDSFFLRMEQGCGAALASLGLSAKAENATRDTSGKLSRMIGRMRGSIEEIQTIEIQMQRMALNATIRAAQLGPSGDALSVLASAMQQLAAESRQRSETLVKALQSMSERAIRLSGNAGTESSNQNVLQEMRRAVADLHSSRERSVAQITQIVDCGARLSGDLSATHDNLSVGALFADTVSRVREMLQELGEKNPRSMPREGGEALEDGLADLATHYTMQAQRDVHEGVTRAVVGTVGVVAAPEKAEEFGENVEFF